MSDATRLSCPLENVSRLGCNFQLGGKEQVTSPRFIADTVKVYTRVINDVAKNGISSNVVEIKFLRREETNRRLLYMLYTTRPINLSDFFRVC